MGQAKLRGSIEDRKATAQDKKSSDGSVIWDEFPPVPDATLVVKVVHDGITLIVENLNAEAFTSGAIILSDRLINGVMAGHGDPRTSAKAMDYLRGSAVHVLKGTKKNERKKRAGVTTMLWIANAVVDDHGSVGDRIRRMIEKAGKAALTISSLGEDKVSFLVASEFASSAAG